MSMPSALMPYECEPSLPPYGESTHICPACLEDYLGSSRPMINTGCKHPGLSFLSIMCPTTTHCYVERGFMEELLVNATQSEVLHDVTWSVKTVPWSVKTVPTNTLYTRRTKRKKERKRKQGSKKKNHPCFPLRLQGTQSRILTLLCLPYTNLKKSRTEKKLVIQHAQ